MHRHIKLKDGRYLPRLIPKAFSYAGIEHLRVFVSLACGVGCPVLFIEAGKKFSVHSGQIVRDLGMLIVDNTLGILDGDIVWPRITFTAAHLLPNGEFIVYRENDLPGALH